jgi:hypothetical protein
MYDKEVKQDHFQLPDFSFRTNDGKKVTEHYIKAREITLQ